MTDPFEIWKFAAGLGLFLYGLSLVESGLAHLAGRSFKKFLRKHTQNPVKSILAGAISTALLQSSSVVTLMLLALVGSGVLSLTNAIGLVIGSNLGTTFTGWIVTVVGFHLEISELVLPFIVAGCFGLVFLKRFNRIHYISKLLLGLGFLFFGLDYMKTSMMGAEQYLDVEALSAQYGPLAFLFAGLVVTAIIQSSSATMVIALTALNASIITLPMAAALVIGADIGTTATVILGALNGTPSKKRVALAHFFFNLITDIVAFLLMPALLYMIAEVLGVSDPLVSLVLFHSSFNFVGILLFFPFLSRFATYLKGWFREDDSKMAKYIYNIQPHVSEEAIEALEKETQRLAAKVMTYYLSAFKLPAHRSGGWAELLMGEADNSLERYDQIKQLEGEVLGYALGVQEQPLSKEESAQLSQSLSVLRNAVLSAKSIKDIRPDLVAFESSAKDIIHDFYRSLCQRASEYYDQVKGLGELSNQALVFEQLVSLMQLNKVSYDSFISEVYSVAGSQKLSEVNISTLLNVNRELYQANLSLVNVFKGLLLEAERAKDLEEIPL